jgi:hypothetical protein
MTSLRESLEQCIQQDQRARQAGASYAEFRVKGQADEKAPELVDLGSFRAVAQIRRDGMGRHELFGNLHRRHA